MRSLRAVLALAVVSAGLAVVATTAAPAAAVACRADSAGLWRSCVEASSGDGVVIEDVTYGASVGGTVCRPDDADDAAPHPILVVNHGGFRALRPTDLAVCTAWAADGWFVVASHYRAMNVAPAGDDLCAGEVDDVLAMLAIAGRHPGADPTRVVMRGGSHGGCVTLRAYQRGVPGLLAAAAFMPLSDPAATVEFAADPGVRGQIARSTGGTAAAYAERSPAMPASDVPLLVTHGVDDRIIDVRDSCRLVDGRGFEAFHRGDGPVPCADVDWSSTDPREAGWPGDRYFLAYDGVGHAIGPMAEDVDGFLRAVAGRSTAMGSGRPDRSS